jgi:hypothetical protein
VNPAQQLAQARTNAEMTAIAARARGDAAAERAALDELAALDSKAARRCKDCEAGWQDTGHEPPRPGRPRSAPYPGPRCYAHHNVRRRAVKAAAHGRRVARVYRITAELYAALLAAQGGRCAGCRRATGKTKRLAVDHDHALARLHDHPDDEGCPACIRGLLCGPCNDVVAHFRDDPMLLVGLANYLLQPPAQAVLTGTLST